jgi:hypothetical protein
MEMSVKKKLGMVFSSPKSNNLVKAPLVFD